MAISTQLIGKLGGIETQETRIDDNTTTTIPAGWRKAAGVFRGQMVYGTSNGTVFGTSLRPIGSGDTVPVNGGGVLTAGDKTSFRNVSGTLTWYRLE